METPAFQDLYPDHWAHCYGCGRLNEHGLKIRSFWDGDETVAAIVPRPHHTAIPGFVYGGLYLWYTIWMDRRGGDNVNHSAHLPRPRTRVRAAAGAVEEKRLRGAGQSSLTAIPCSSREGAG